MKIMSCGRQAGFGTYVSATDHVSRMFNIGDLTNYPVGSGILGLYLYDIADHQNDQANRFKSCRPSEATGIGNQVVPYNYTNNLSDFNLDKKLNNAIVIRDATLFMPLGVVVAKP